MNIATVSEELWNDLGFAIGDPKVIDELKNLAEDSVHAAKMRAEELAGQIKSGYAGRPGKPPWQTEADEILNTVLAVSAGYKVIAKSGSDLIAVAKLPLASPAILFTREEVSIGHYLKEEYGASEDDVRKLIEFSNCWAIYSNAMKQIRKKVNEELGETVLVPLPVAVETAIKNIDRLNPTPSYQDGFLTYEIYNKDAGFPDEFNKEEMLDISNLVTTYCRGMKISEFPGEYGYIIPRLQDLGLLDSNLTINEERYKSSTVLVMNRLWFSLDEYLKIPSDLEKLKNLKPTFQKDEAMKHY